MNDGVSYTVENTTVGNTITGSTAINEIQYDGIVSDGDQKSVFAFLGKPADFDSSKKYPAVVLVHGGGGSADPRWVKKWNDAGFVAISIDMYGNRITGLDSNSNYVKAENDTALRTNPYSAATSFKAKAEESMMYNNVINVIHAHNLLRSLDYVDNDKIGISGISWGAVTTSTVIGIDNRFAFAVPIYGCGYLYESETEFKTMLGDNLYWDPSNYIEDANIPTLWMNSNADPFFSINAFSKSYKLSANVSGNARMIIKDKASLSHGQNIARNLTEPIAFAKSIVSDGVSLPLITSTVFSDNTVNVRFSASTASSASLMYNTDANIPYQGSDMVWSEAAASISNGTITAEVPDDAQRFYINIKDSTGAVIASSELIER